MSSIDGRAHFSSGSTILSSCPLVEQLFQAGRHIKIGREIAVVGENDLALGTQATAPRTETLKTFTEVLSQATTVILAGAPIKLADPVAGAPSADRSSYALFQARMRLAAPLLAATTSAMRAGTCFGRTTKRVPVQIDDPLGDLKGVLFGS